MTGKDSLLREVETVTGDWGGGAEHLAAGTKCLHLYWAQLDLAQGHSMIFTKSIKLLN